MEHSEKNQSINAQALSLETIEESLRDWFKKEKWVRISTSGNIAGPCGTSKNKKNPDRCLPKAKAQSLSKAERAATARKKKKAGKKGKTVVANTKKAKVTREDIQNLIVGLIYEMQNENTIIMEKDDRCTRIAKQKYDTWPSAYASGAVVRCRRGEIWKDVKEVTNNETTMSEDKADAIRWFGNLKYYYQKAFAELRGEDRETYKQLAKDFFSKLEIDQHVRPIGLNENEDWPKGTQSRYQEYSFKLVKVMPDRAKYLVTDMETGEVKGTVIFNTVDQLHDYAGDLIKPQGGTQSTHLG